MSNVDVDYDYIDDEKETKHAYFVVFEEDFFDEVSCFVPKSKVTIDANHKVISMPEWLAIKEELI
jgi:hypothetical protein